MKRPARDIARHALTYLVAGALFSFALAIVPPLFINASWHFRNRSAGMSRTWPVPVPATWPEQPYSIGRNDGFLCEVIHVGGPVSIWEGPPPPKHMNSYVEIFRAGWPLRMLETVTFQDLPDIEDQFGGAQTPPPIVSHRLDLPKQWLPRTNGWADFIPYGPLWLGIAFDGAFFGAVLFAAAYSIRRYRNARRGWRGGCQWCGYATTPTNSTAVCPECGRDPGLGLGRKNPARHFARAGLVLAYALTGVCITYLSAWLPMLYWSQMPAASVRESTIDPKDPRSGWPAEFWGEEGPPLPPSRRTIACDLAGTPLQGLRVERATFHYDNESTHIESHLDEIVESTKAGWPLPVTFGWRMTVHYEATFNFPKSSARVIPPTDRTTERTQGFLQLIPPPPGTPGVRMWPYLPVWPGFAINTAFFATLAWLAARAVRKHRKRKSRRASALAAAAPQI